MIGTEYLLIILLWCGDPQLGISAGQTNAVMHCRKQALECVSGLKDFTTNDVIGQCLPTGAKK